MAGPRGVGCWVSSVFRSGVWGCPCAAGAVASCGIVSVEEVATGGGGECSLYGVVGGEYSNG